MSIEDPESRLQLVLLLVVHSAAASLLGSRWTGHVGKSEHFCQLQICASLSPALTSFVKTLVPKVQGCPPQLAASLGQSVDTVSTEQAGTPLAPIWDPSLARLDAQRGPSQSCSRHPGPGPGASASASASCICVRSQGQGPQGTHGPCNARATSPAGSGYNLVLEWNLSVPSSTVSSRLA